MLQKTVTLETSREVSLPGFPCQFPILRLQSDQMDFHNHLIFFLAPTSTIIVVRPAENSSALT